MLSNAQTSDRIDTLIFDLFGVVVAFDDSIVYQRLAAHCADPDLALLALRDLVSHPDLIRGRLTLEDLREQLDKPLGLRLDAAEFEDIWLEPYTFPAKGMEELLNALSKSYRLVLLSNVDRYYWNVIQRLHPEVRYFQSRVLSWEHGAAKPDRPSFERAVEAAKTIASRCYLVDDKAENIEAALGCGISGHLFKGMEGLRASLLSLGIAC